MSLRLYLFVSDLDSVNEDCMPRGWLKRFSCVAPGMERFSLDRLRAVKKECSLEVGCRGVWNLWSQAKNFFDFRI